MRYSYDFIEGPITNRLLGALKNRDAKSIVSLFQAGKFRIYQKAEYQIMSKSLLAAHIEDYVKDSGYTVHDIFFGYGAEVDTNYTPCDKIVLDFLAQTPDSVLETIFTNLQKLYPNDFFYYGQNFRPTQKFREAFNRLPRGSLDKGNKAFGTPGTRHLSKEAQEDIGHYLKNHKVASYTFNTNCMPEYAQFLGISLHWFWNLTVPLYCKSQVADLIFDYYTMMQPRCQAEFVYFILYCLDIEEQKVSQALSQINERKESIVNSLGAIE